MTYRTVRLDNTIVIPEPSADFAIVSDLLDGPSDQLPAS